MSGKARPWQKTMEFFDGLKGDLPDEELAAIKRYVERRSRKTAQVTVTPVSTAQHCLPRLLNPEIASDVYVSMEEKDEGRMNPEPTELEPPSASTGLETPGQQCPLNEGVWETGRPITDGYLLVVIGSNQGGDISSPKERVGTRAGSVTTPANSSNTIFRQQGHKPKDKDNGSEENKQFDPGGKGEKPPLYCLSFFWGERWVVGCPLLVLRGFLSVCVFLLVLYSLFVSDDHLSAS